MRELDRSLWEKKVVHSECTLHQLSPYIGKMKSSMAKVLLRTFSKEGDVIFDPFVGSGTVALESIILGRNIICSDVNLYAITLTKGKIFSPFNVDEALSKTRQYLKESVQCDFEQTVPSWVADFFHPQTLQEILSFSHVLRLNKRYFLLSCLMGILHHERPGFLSYPSSHSTPYLKNNKYPISEYPKLYDYRPLKPRIISKVKRAFKRVPIIDPAVSKVCFNQDVRDINLPENSIDLILTSPPYMDTLDYIRDNRLRLWFLGYNYGVDVENKNPSNLDDFKSLMKDCFGSFQYILKPGGKIVLVLGDVMKSKLIKPLDIILKIIEKHENFKMNSIIEDKIQTKYGSSENQNRDKGEYIVVIERKI